MSWITKEKRLAIYGRDNYTCQYCGKIMTQNGLTLDHIKSRLNGGSNKPNNLITACLSCNSKKKERSAKEYLEFLVNMRRLTSPKKDIILMNIAKLTRRSLKNYA